jgi:hypothetical protein
MFTSMEAAMTMEVIIIVSLMKLEAVVIFFRPVYPVDLG